MSQNDAAITKVDVPDELGWHNREEVMALAGRIKTMMPGDLGKEEALLLAQYSAAMDANPYRGDVYAFKSKGKLVLVEGYKILIRWARNQCNFSDRYARLRDDEIPEGALGHRCQVLRDDAKDMLETLVKAGAPWQEAFDIASQSAVGVVTKQDMFTRDGRPIPPPKGWTWDEVAKKRSLKNALNRAYGAPSPREMARQTWMVNGVETAAGDWENSDPLEARANAQDRERRKCIAEKSGPEAYGDLYGSEPEWALPEADPETGEIAEPKPAPEPETTFSTERPYDAATVKAGLESRVAKTNPLGSASASQIPFLARKFTEAFAPAEDATHQYHVSLAWLTGKTSANDLTFAWAMALLDWLLGGNKPDSTGDTPLGQYASAEAGNVYRQAMIEAGQLVMELEEENDG